MLLRFRAGLKRGILGDEMLMAKLFTLLFVFCLYFLKSWQIVWDEKKNQWVNLNEPEEEVGCDCVCWEGQVLVFSLALWHVGPLFGES